MKIISLIYKREKIRKLLVHLGQAGASEKKEVRQGKTCNCLEKTAAIRQIFIENPSEFDPRKYLGPARDKLTKMIIHKNTSVLGSAGRY